jgi:type VI secretion system protein VasG
MLPDISAEFLKKMMEGDVIAKVAIDVDKNEFTYSFD